MRLGQGAFAFRPSAWRAVLAVVLVFALASCGPPTPTLDLEEAPTSDASADATADAAPSQAPPSAVDAGDEDGARPTSSASLDACLRACERSLPEGVSKLRSVFGCAELRCYPACVAFEAADAGDAGSDGGDGGPYAPLVCRDVGNGPGKFTWFDPACDACLVAECCAFVTTCMTDTSCDALNQCQDACYAPETDGGE